MRARTRSSEAELERRLAEAGARWRRSRAMPRVVPLPPMPRWRHDAAIALALAAHQRMLARWRVRAAVTSSRASSRCLPPGAGRWGTIAAAITSSECMHPPPPRVDSPPPIPDPPGDRAFAAGSAVVAAPAGPGATCRNCGAEAPDRYCPACGQETALALPTAGVFLREAAGRYVALDGRFARTLFHLLFRPGFLTNEYFAGRRRRYIRPARLFLVLALALFAVLRVVTEAVPGSALLVLDGDRGAEIAREAKAAAQIAREAKAGARKAASPERRGRGVSVSGPGFGWGCGSTANSTPSPSVPRACARPSPAADRSLQPPAEAGEDRPDDRRRAALRPVRADRAAAVVCVAAADRLRRATAQVSSAAASLRRAPRLRRAQPRLRVPGADRRGRRAVAPADGRRACCGCSAISCGR